MISRTAAAVIVIALTTVHIALERFTTRSEQTLHLYVVHLQDSRDIQTIIN